MNSKLLAILVVVATVMVLANSLAGASEPSLKESLKGLALNYKGYELDKCNAMVAKVKEVEGFKRGREYLDILHNIIGDPEYSGSVGFGEFCARNSASSGAIRIVNLLNKIYTTFDVLTEPKRNPYVYKVETVGDKYMAVSGLPEACDSHARHINRLALDIYDLAKTIRLEEYTGGLQPSGVESGAAGTTSSTLSTQQATPTGGELTRMDQCEHLRVTIGVHCGEVVTGVIGKRTPRYCLFGNTVNLTSRCETTGKKGSINVSQDVYNLCMKDPNNFDPGFEFEYRGQINMKGKTEPMGMWLLTRRNL